MPVAIVVPLTISRSAPEVATTPSIRIADTLAPVVLSFAYHLADRAEPSAIPAPFHIDNANLKNCVNVIITKRLNSKGGNLHVPDYNATFDSCNNSMLVYPAWKNIHGVTPIIPTHEGGYRNSLIFYPLKAFKKFVK